MTLSEKLVYLRKKHNMSADELATRLGINKRTLMRWERAEAMPDISKIVELSDIFGISTDALLKDEISLTEDCIPVPQGKRRHISYSDVADYLKNKFKAAYLIALATFTVMISPGVMLVIMSLPGRSQILLNGIGLTALLILISASLAIYTYSHIITGKYDYISTEEFTVDYTATDMLNKTEEKTLRAYTVRNIGGIVLAVLSLTPLIITALVPNVTNLAIMIALTSTLAIAGIAVVMFITSGIKRSAIASLTQSKKTQIAYSKRLEEAIHGSFWTLTVATYIFYSMKSGNWHMSWLILIFAASISGIIATVFNLVRHASGSHEKNKKDN